MFIKYGKERHLRALLEKGEICFNPCKYFRDLEEEQKKKGIGDGNDGGLTTEFITAKAIRGNGKEIVLNNQTMSIIVEPALKTPIFCIRRAESELISREYRNKLREQFPEYTHALIIEDENRFLENIRYSFRNRAFSHEIFYQNKICVDFIDFLLSGNSDTSFYLPKKRKRYFMEIRYNLIGNPDKQNRLIINDTNFYRTMFRKEVFFKDQMEYRIVLPYEQIESLNIYNICPVNAKLVNIDELVKSDT